MNNPFSSDKKTASPPDETSSRFNIAKLVLVFSLITVAVLGLATIYFGMYLGDKDKFAFAKDILSMLLPVIGAWTGTILAFYFSKENFDAASKHTQELVKQMTPDEKLRAVNVKDAMLTREKGLFYVLTKPETDVNLQSDLVALLDSEKRQRLPILDADGRIKYMIHRSLLDSFLLDACLSKKDLSTITLGDMLNDPDRKRTIMESFKTFAGTATLADVKSAMDYSEFCADAFVTDDGTDKTKVLGWITNSMVREKLKA